MGLPSRRVNWWPQIFQREGLPEVALHKQEDAGFGLDCVYSNRHAGTLQQAYRSEQTNRACRTEKKEKKSLWRRLKKRGKKEAHCRFHTARGGQNKQDEAARRHVVQKTPVMRLWNRDSRGKWELKQSNFHVVFSATLHDAVLQQLHEVQFDLQQKCAHEGRGKDMQSVGKHVNIDLFGTKDSLIDSKKCLKMTYTFCPLYSCNQCFWDSL